MPMLELTASIGEGLRDVALRHRPNPSEHQLHPRRPIGVDLLARQERLGDDAPCIRNEMNRVGPCHPEFIHANPRFTTIVSTAGMTPRYATVPAAATTTLGAE